MLAFPDVAPRRGRAVLVAVLAAALGATLLAVSPAAGARTTHARTAYEARIANRILTMINHERRAHHLKALSSSRQLQLSARRHDLTMSQFNSMSHQLPSEAFFGTRLRAAGYRWKWAGENIGYNSRMDTGGVRRLETLMYHEKAPNDGHRRNILNPHFRNVGVDVYIDRAHHKVWLTTDFGRR